MMFWRETLAELETLRKENEQQDRDKQAAQLNFQRSLRRLSDHLGMIGLDDSMAAIRGDLAENRRTR